MAVFEPCEQYNRFTGIQRSGLQEEYRNDSSMYSNTGPIRSYFIVSPQWLSEKIEAPPTTSRGHRPWPFEFPGARTARRPASAKTTGIPEDEDEYERQKVELTMSSGLPAWSSLSSSPRAWVNPAKYSYQLDSSRFETGGAQQQPSRLSSTDVWLNPQESRDKQPAPIITPYPRYKDGPRPPTPPQFGRIPTSIF